MTGCLIYCCAKHGTSSYTGPNHMTGCLIFCCTKHGTSSYTGPNHMTGCLIYCCARQSTSLSQDLITWLDALFIVVLNMVYHRTQVLVTVLSMMHDASSCTGPNHMTGCLIYCCAKHNTWCYTWYKCLSG